MKVKELVEALGKLDPQLEVLCYTEEQDLLAKNHMFRLLDIESVEVSEGTQVRGQDGVPSLKLGKGDLSKKFAFINVMSDF
jgi:hypothetical protein